MSTPYPFDFPVVLGAQGAQPTPPATINQQLVAAVAASQPGYTARLPGLLIEDISSTVVAAIAQIDQSRIELINSLTAAGANDFLLQQLGQLTGLTLGSVTNTTVPVVFTGTVGYVIPNGFLVGDGTNTYQVLTGGVIQSGGSSGTITAVAVQPGSFGVPANTVTQLLTSVGTGVALTVNNPSAGTPGSTGETASQFRARVMQANLAASVGTPRYIKTLLEEIPGVTQNLVSIQQVSGGGVRVIASGADVYSIAYAIFMGIADVSELQGSAVNSARNVTVSLIDPPNVYSVLYVNTPQQTVTMTVTWNTVATNFTGGAAFAGLVQQPLVNYINALAPGQVINVLEMNAIFQQAISGVLNPTFLTRLVFAVYINTVYTAPASGTYEISGDAESNFFAQLTGITVVQG